MQMRQLFNLFQDVQDLLSMFENVASTPQMVSCLERIKRGQAPEDLLGIVQSLRVSLTEALDANLELGSLTETTNEEVDDNIADELLEESNWDEKNGALDNPEDIHVALTPPPPLDKPET